MKTLIRLISSNFYAALGAALTLGVLLSFIHGETQKLLLPMAEWMRVSFIINSSNQSTAEVVVNILYQVASFGTAALCILLPIRKTTIMRDHKLLSAILLSCLVIQYHWVLTGIIFGFNDILAPAIPLIPVVIAANALSFYLAKSLALQNITP